MLATPAAPMLETDRLVLRGWRSDDHAAYAALLAELETARFITRSGRPYDAAQVWSEMAYFVGHWQMLGHGMFVVEERSSRSFLGRVGTLHPPHWPGFDVGWALSAAARGKGYATEAAEAVIRWSSATLSMRRITSIIHPDNVASQRVAVRLGERRTDERFAPFGEQCDIWERQVQSS